MLPQGGYVPFWTKQMPAYSRRMRFFVVALLRMTDGGFHKGRSPFGGGVGPALSVSKGVSPFSLLSPQEWGVGGLRDNNKNQHVLTFEPVCCILQTKVDSA